VTRLHTSTGGPAGPGRTSLDDLDPVRYGPGIPGEDSLKLLGHLDGRRVLELGCSPGTAVTMARAGAKVIVVDESEEALAAAREAAGRADVRIEIRHGPLAELAFVRADTIDVAVSVYGLAAVADIDRVFRQVHRVLRPERPLVLSLPHPAFALLGAGAGAGAGGGVDVGDGADAGDAGDGLRPRRRWWDDRPTPWPMTGGRAGQAARPRTVSTLFTSLGRANFRVDAVAEPPVDRTALPPGDWHDALDWVPPTLILRARKQGL
jgi:SAM-dependent methyltransferase